MFGSDKILSWKSTTPFEVRYLAISTASGNTGRWQMEDDLGKGTHICRHIHGVIYELCKRGCRDRVIESRSDDDDDNAIILYLKHFKRFFITSNIVLLVLSSFFSQRLRSCYHALLQPTVPNATLILSLKLYCNSAAEKYNISSQHATESINYIITPGSMPSADPNIKYNVAWIDSPEKDFFQFGVRACADASLLISNRRVSRPMHQPAQETIARFCNTVCLWML